MQHAESISEPVIERNIPLPVTRERHVGQTAALRKLGVGDSVLLSPRSRAGLSTNAKRVGIKVCSRIEDNGLRIWRTA